jgi:hypothetical protein
MTLYRGARISTHTTLRRWRWQDRLWALASAVWLAALWALFVGGP